MKIEEEYYNSKEVAKLIGLRNHKTLAQWRSKKKNPTLKFTRVGGTIRYLKKHVEKWLSDNTVGED